MYGIEKLPAFVVTGNAAGLQPLVTRFGTPLKQGAFVYESPQAPYYSVSEDRIVGTVDILVLNDSSCATCYNASIIPEIFDAQGVAVGDVTYLEYNSTDGIAIISDYNITRLPAVIVSSEINYYGDFAESVKQSSTQTFDGNYLLAIITPYKDVSGGTVHGIVDVVYLNDSSCTQCYNVTDHEAAIVSFGIYVNSRRTFDVSSAEGRQLIARYNITAVPTILFSPEASAYSSLGRVWSSVGSVEPDGWFVFRDPSTIGAYKNLTTGRIVNETG
ncbi:Thioredoxin domain protein [uncultured archaeon]|nr:Thioredoxin domain protein [uncultured archaeon]